MSNNASFCDKGREFVQKAIAADEQKDYVAAKQFYTNAIEYFLHYCKYEKNQAAVRVVRGNVMDYIKRAEVISKFLKENPNYSPKNGTAQTQRGVPGQDPSAGNVGGGGAQANGSSSSSAKPISAFQAEKCNVSWDDVAGLQAAKAYIRQAAIIPLQMPHLFKNGGVLEPWKGILLFGPPGTGKTFLAKAVSTEAKATFLSISSSDIFTKWVGESEGQLKSLFQQARACDGACIIFIDEIDALCRKREEGDSEVNRRVLTEMLRQMDGIKEEGSGNARVLVMGATNRPWELDSGILRRFEKRVYIPLPDAVTRKAMITKLMTKAVENDGIELQVSPEMIDNLISMTDLFSASDMSIMFKEALMNLVRKLEDATHFRALPDGNIVPCSPGDPRSKEMSWIDVKDKSIIRLPPLTDSDILSAMRNAKSSVVQDDLAQFNEFAENMGVQG